MEAVTMQADKRGHKASRTCVGCHAPIDACGEGSFRLVLVPPSAGGAGAAHDVAVDLAGGSFGRGAHLHATPACVEKACAGGFSKAFRRPVRADATKLALDVERAAEARIVGLLLGARRAGLLAFGEEAKGHSAEDAPLFVVACDAGASALGGPLRQAVKDGRVLAFGTKETLGTLFSRELVAKVAVRHESVAREIRRASSLSVSLGRSHGCTFREVR